jgi:Ca2+-binding EF-hand superfamily protein
MTRTTRAGLLSGAAFALFALPALAQDAPTPPPPGSSFEELDANKDGTIDKSEFDAHRPSPSRPDEAKPADARPDDAKDDRDGPRGKHGRDHGARDQDNDDDRWDDRDDRDDRRRHRQMRGDHGERQLRNFERMFNRADSDGDGTVTDDELEDFRERVLGRGHEDRAGAFFDRLDDDGDGQISREEFSEAMERMRDRQRDRD